MKIIIFTQIIVIYVPLIERVMFYIIFILNSDYSCDISL